MGWLATLAAVACLCAQEGEVDLAGLRAMEPGAARAAACLDELRRAPELTREELELVFAIADQEARALHLEDALPIFLELHRRYAAGWSAVNLALTWNRLGEHEQVDAVLARAIEVERTAGRPEGDLWSQWGIFLLGRGNEARARDVLGRGLARGSADAALVLARLDLARGRLRAARIGVRALMLVPRPAAWAQRTYGLALLGP